MVDREAVWELAGSWCGCGGWGVLSGSLSVVLHPGVSRATGMHKYRPGLVAKVIWSFAAAQRERVWLVPVIAV